MIRLMLSALALAVWPLAASAERDAVRAYVFGNSLVNHLGEQDHTNVPHWLNEMARADGRSLALDGQWGFLRNFSDGLPPSANWSFPGVRGAWSPGASGFGEAGFDAVVITPANFIQYQLPDVPYDGDNPTGESPLGAVLRLTDWLLSEAPETRLFLYEGWAEMVAITGGFPPSEAALQSYHAANGGPYHDWYQDLLDGVAAARPEAQMRLIPVASVLAGLLQDGGVLDNLTAEDLYTDGDPHGTPTLYFLAAMVTYGALYDAPPPEGYRPPATLHPDVVARYPALRKAIWAALPKTPQEARSRAAVTEAIAAAPLPDRQPVALPPSGLRPEGVPALGMGLNGIADWSTQHPFVDLMKTARGWVGHLPGQWGGVSFEDLQAGGHLDEHGWPVSIPDGVERLESVLLTDQPPEAVSLRGDYVVVYDGSGELDLTGRAKRVRYAPGRITFSYEPGDGVVGLSLSEIPADDPVRNMHIFRAEHEALFEAGVLFNPAWIETVQDLRAVRFMDWMVTNGSSVSDWAERPRMSDAFWSTRGVPVEVMIALANRIGADPWFTMPHLADDEYMRRFAEAVRDGLDPRLKAYVEFSNEVWNRIFPQAQWASERAEALWGPSDTGWMQFYGLRAAQVMDIWSEVFGPAAEDRLIRVVATHTGWPGLEQDILVAPLAFLTLGKPPKDSFDAYAVTGYFGYEMGGPEMAPRLRDWLDKSELAAQAAGQAEGLRRVALREFVRERRFDGAIAPVAQALEEGSLRQLVDEVFPYHAGVAYRNDLQLVMYEGGTHVAGHGAQVNDERLTAFFTAFNYTPEMARLYELLLAGWVDAGGTLFNAFVDVAPATQWGSWGALRHLDDANPRWDMLMAFNATGRNDWERRDPAAFAEGKTRRGGSGTDRLIGTAEEDVLLAGPGADTLVSAGGADNLHGGSGPDRAVLPGARGDYRLGREGGRLVAYGPDGPVVLTAIEEIVFADAPDQVLAASSF